MSNIPLPATLDLTNLREIIDGDKEVEKELFMAFLQCSHENMIALSKLVDGSNPESWREHAHSLKGEAANLGATKLTELGRLAQDSFAAQPDVKKALFIQIEEELGIISAYLKQIIE